jgi:hypothetical protein
VHIRGQFLGESIVNFELNNENYFLDLSEDARQWLVLVETATGARRIPVYVDAPESEDVRLLIADEKQREIVN